MDAPYKLSVVVTQEGGWFVAQCLEYDIAAQGRTIKDVLYEFGRTVVGHIILCQEDGSKLDDIPPAPPRYWHLFEDGRDFRTEEPPFRIPPEVTTHIPRIPEAVMRIY